ncbi:MAG: single-stranded-DNA-specific exonuclease RecJ [Chloroflexota bacterium]
MRDLYGRSDGVKRWNISPTIPPHVLRHLNSYHPVIAQVLYNRGQDTPDKARAFLDGNGLAHDPFALSGMAQAVGRIRQAIKRREPIVVYGDFDADGVTSTALLVQALGALSAHVTPYIPHRVDEGYGLNVEALRALHQQGARLVITVDCGIRSVEEVAYGQRIGLDMIVTDHHSVGEQRPDDAVAVINPKLDARLRLEDGRPNGYPEDMLAGVGVAYKLAQALFQATEANDRRHFRPSIQLEDLLDLVALGTVADLAPLDRLENRDLVRRGLQVLNRAQRLGVYELLQVAGINLEQKQVNAMTIGFMLGPRLNAAGRLDSAMIAYQLLTATDQARASALAQQLQALNEQRQAITSETVEIARELAFEAGDDLPIIFAASDAFRPGIVGLVAGRLCEEFYRPAVVIQEGETESRGSCRSIAEFDITAALDQCADLLVRHGGHAQAAGFTVRNENLPVLRERLMALAQDALAGRELRPTLDVDAEVQPGDLTDLLAYELRRLEPTGAGNDAPLFVARGLRVSEARRVGAEGKHLRLRFGQGGYALDGIAFKLGDWAGRLEAEMDVAFHLELNEWNGRVKPQLNVQDLRPAGQPD